MKRFRDGPHAVYQGREFRLAILDGGNLELASEDSADISLGFTKYYEGLYVLPVKRPDLQEVFSIHPVARYQGFEFGIHGQDTDKAVVSLTTGDEKIAERLDFDRADKFYWEKWVSVDELEKTWEIKTPLNL
jgi:hypothetical protein